MKLVTLEGLPKMCLDVVKVLHHSKSLTVLPAPIAPSPTSLQNTPADDVCTALSNAAARMKMLHRMNLASSSIVCGGCHWIESPPLGMRGRAILHRLTQELSKAVAEEYEMTIEHHMIVVLSASVHECFETLLSNMEGRDHTMHDVVEEAGFLESLTRIPGIMSAFPYSVERVTSPPYIQDNEHDLVTTAMRIAAIIKHGFCGDSR